MTNETKVVINTEKLLNALLKRKNPSSVLTFIKSKRQSGVVRRTHSPKNTPFLIPPIVSSSFSSEVTNDPTITSNNNNNVHAPLLPPTVEGISEAARSTIVAFPTETVYLVGCMLNDSDAVRKLILLKEQFEGKATTSADFQHEQKNTLDPNAFVNPPIVCIASIKQAKGFINFNADKSYALVTPPPKSTATSIISESSSFTPTPQVKKRMFVTKFSEGKLVFSRLVSKFWPGPFVIFVPSSTLPSEVLMKVTTTNINCTSSSSSSDIVEEKKTYVGLCCPSHPLARRLLESSKTPLVTFAAAAANSSSSSSNVDDADVYCSSAVEIQTALQSCSTSTTYKLIVPCINGEDKREVFAVPTCELGIPSTVVLIQEETRTIHVLRAGKFITQNDITHALLRRCSSNHHNNNPTENQRQREILKATVLMKWRVVQHEAVVE